MRAPRQNCMANEAQRQVRVVLRHVTLAETATLTELADGGVFIALDDPPPVKSVVRVWIDDGQARAVEVVRVTESGHETPDGASGCFGRWVEVEPEIRHAVGTEAIAPGPAQSSGEEPPPDAGDEPPEPDRVEPEPEPEPEPPADAASAVVSEVGAPQPVEDMPSFGPSVDALGASYPVPAPVVEPEPSEPIRVGKSRKGRKRG